MTNAPDRPARGGTHAGCAHECRRNCKAPARSFSAGLLPRLRTGDRARRLRERARTAALSGELYPARGDHFRRDHDGVADFAMYVAGFSAVGPQPLAVTTNLSINFLRKPRQADLVADARLLKVGKRLAVGEVTIFSDSVPEPVAHVTSTYSIPSNGN